MTGSWTVIAVPEVHEWLMTLNDTDPGSYEQVLQAIRVLTVEGPALGRPLVDTLANCTLNNLKELRPGSRGRTEIRILFLFDPRRQAVLLVAGDKSGQWNRWYRTAIRAAEARYQAYLENIGDAETDRRFP
ncbi:type II toxin-antitoxin system RelE/ParE family toxin [Actinomadura alba]|uniref:Type II toxin-antitoxin system RelE/ParE family toxin n=1 Tax=Actinomadura alba TaxID=406431 RepID=A0ABR7LPX0_9ACTN|nr:type II toxin-antitoxin system RelE/ParE family toxin [Actinomadura alba]MBC6466891.1 type II toxin-antitoxin system RelE/ParE family toxin [Actinomadura alba]